MDERRQIGWGRPGAEPVRSLPPAPGWSPGFAPPPAPEGLSYWQIAWSHKWILLGFLLLGAIGGTTYVIFRTPLYSASTTVELVGFNQSFMNMSQVDPQAGTDTTTASASNIQTQMRILTSRTILSRVMDRMNLEMTPVTTPPGTIFTKVRSKIPWGQKEPLEQSKDALLMAWKTVNAKGVGSTRLIEISCQSTSPEVAANFLNTLGAEHISQTLAARSMVTQRTSQWMESQLEEAKARLEQAGAKLREFVKQSGMDFFPEQATLADSKLRALQTDLAGIQADRIAKQARWETAKNTPLDKLPDVMNDPNLGSLRGRIRDLRGEMARLTATLTPEHYKVQKVQAQVTETEQTLEKEETALMKRLESEYQEALRRERMLGGAYHSQTRAVSGQADKASQYAMLKRDVEMAQQVYSSLLQQSNQAALVALVPAGNIRVVDQASPYPIPSTPDPVKDIPTATLLGGGLGYGLLWLRENIRRKKQSGLVTAPGRTRSIAGVPELGVIPSLAPPQPRRLVLPRPLRKSILQADEEQSKVPAIETLRDRSSLLAESFRQTLASILRNRPVDRNPVYVLTSVGPGEGKTTLSANLAIAMADIGQKVLLIDADLRRARLRHLFGAENKKGLSDILTSPTPVTKLALEEFIQPTEVDKLCIMTEGLASVETPALLSFLPSVEEMLSALRKKFDFILLDTGPVMLFPDARLLGRHSDGVVLIVRAGVTSQDGLMMACQRFAEDGVPVLGTILNDWAQQKANQAYYSYSAYEDSSRKS